MKPDITGRILCFVDRPRVARRRSAAPSPPPCAQFHRISLGVMRDERRSAGNRRTLKSAPARPGHPGPAPRGRARTPSHARRGGATRAGLFEATPPRPCSSCFDPSRTTRSSPLHRPALLLSGLLCTSPRTSRHRCSGPARPHGGDPPGRLHREETHPQIARHHLIPRQLLENHGHDHPSTVVFETPRLTSSSASTRGVRPAQPREEICQHPPQVARAAGGGRRARGVVVNAQKV